MCFCGYQNEQRLFPHTGLSDWVLVTEAECVYCVVRTEFVYVNQVNFSIYKINEVY